MSIGLFILLLIWIAACTAKPAKKSFLDGITARRTDRTPEEIIRNYGKDDK